MYNDNIVKSGIRRLSKWGFKSTFSFYWNVRYRNNYIQNRKRSLSFPHQVMVEVTNRCNIRCIMCPREIMTRSVGDMDYGLYKRLLDEISMHHSMGYLVLHYSGEPMLHESIYDMIRYAKDRGVGFVKFNTNGLLVNSKSWKKLVDSGLDMIVFAVEASRELHNRFRIGSNYDLVNDNIKGFMVYKKNVGSRKPVVVVQMLVAKDIPKKVLLDADARYSPCVDFVNIRSISTVGGQVKDHGTLRELEKVCKQVYTTVGVLFNGDVVPCCVDHDANLVMGNVKEQSLYDVWNNKRYTDFRMKHKMCNLEDYPFCRRCLSGI